MIKLGKYNQLKVARLVDFGAYLTDGAGQDVLLPAKYIESPLHPGDEIEVFVYRDSEERPIATTEHPYAQVGDFAFLRVCDVNTTGAFLDWGIPKQILVPFRQQKTRLSNGMLVLAYVYLDHVTGRIAASTKIEKFLGNKYPDYKVGDKVTALIYKHTEIGYKAIVNNVHQGMIYDSTLYNPIEIGVQLNAYVKQVRTDGKIDLMLHGNNDGRTQSLAENIAKRLHESPNNYLPISDSSSPEAIRAAFQCSKKDFKKAIGHLYREHRIVIANDGIKLAESKI